MAQPQAHDMQRLRWQCRRGMLELDYLLEAYLERHFAHDEPEQQTTFLTLLNQPDPILQAWLIGQERPDDTGLQSLVDVIRLMRV